MLLMIAAFIGFFEDATIIHVLNYFAMFLTLISIIILITVWSYKKFQIAMLIVIILIIANIVVGGVFLALENGYFRNV